MFAASFGEIKMNIMNNDDDDDNDEFYRLKIVGSLGCRCLSNKQSTH